MDGWMEAKKRTPSSRSYTPTPACSPPYPPFSRGTAYSTRRILHTVFSGNPACVPCPFPLLFSLLFCAPPDAYHRTSGRRVKYIASLVSCSRVGFVPWSSSYLADKRVGRLVGATLFRISTRDSVARVPRVPLSRSSAPRRENHLCSIERL